MLESRPEDGLGSLEETVETVETVETEETVLLQTLKSMGFLSVTPNYHFKRC